MPGRTSEIIINSTDASGSATFYFKDAKNVTLAMMAMGGTNPVATYSIKLYPTPDTPADSGIVYEDQTVAGAVQFFENVTDSNGTPYSFDRMVVSYAGLTNDETSGAMFMAAVSSI